MSRKRQVGAAALGICVLAGLIAWLGGAEAPASPPPPPPPPAMPGPRQGDYEPSPVAAQAPPPERPAEVPPAAVDPAAPVIDAITVEKTEVCEGEENLISLRAHAPDGSDAYLHYSVGGRQGQRIPVRSWIADDGESPKLEVKVFGRDGKVTVADVPPFTVKPCKPARSAFITSRVRANTWSEFEFEVKLVESAVPEGGVAFQPRSYEWNFGDGETAITQTPYALHNYEGRKQDAMFSHLLVEVKVRGDAGEPVVGRTALQLVNPAFEDLATKGVVTLLVQLTPRFPELGSDGVVRQKVRLFHHQDRPVFIHNAVRFRHRRAAPTEPGGQQVVDPSALLGSSTIPPGKGLEFEIKLDTRKEPDVFSVEHYVEGKDSEGRPARGAFSVMRPPPRPTKDNSHPVEDPLLKAKILAARKLLNRPYVTDEDLWQLQRQGKFADLEARAQAAAAQQPEEGNAPPVKVPEPPASGPLASPGEQNGKPQAPPKPRGP
ncbi:PKD domain-containing protein [Stigmatella hybrida]|uniref:PKD domain-containing protein n=1 Tax=Stigmatella hybrida TaxID=394097 RepID=UPI001CDB066A|nr:PKD domain-containing protein [Stigmatella hybrida]